MASRATIQRYLARARALGEMDFDDPRGSETVTSEADQTILRGALLIIYPESRDRDISTRELVRRYIVQTNSERNDRNDQIARTYGYASRFDVPEDIRSILLPTFAELPAVDGPGTGDDITLDHLASIVVRARSSRPQHRDAQNALVELSYEGDSLSTIDQFSTAFAVEAFEGRNGVNLERPGERIITRAQYLRMEAINLILDREEIPATPARHQGFYRQVDLWNYERDVLHNADVLTNFIEEYAYGRDIDTLTRQERTALQESVYLLAQRYNVTPRPMREHEIDGVASSAEIYGQLHRVMSHPNALQFMDNGELLARIEEIALRPETERDVTDMDQRSRNRVGRELYLANLSEHEKFELEMAIDLLARRLPDLGGISPIEAVDGAYSSPEINYALGQILQSDEVQQRLAGTYREPGNDDVQLVSLNDEPPDALRDGVVGFLQDNGLMDNDQVQGLLRAVRWHPDQRMRAIVTPTVAVTPDYVPHDLPVEDGARDGSATGARIVEGRRGVHDGRDFKPIRMYHNADATKFTMQVVEPVRNEDGEITNAAEMTAGVINAPTRILASAEGSLLCAIRNHPQYGNCMIIRHADGVCTLYAHCQPEFMVDIPREAYQPDLPDRPGTRRPYVFFNEAALNYPDAAGDPYRIERGQPIAWMGNTGSRTTATHLHYAQAVEMNMENLQRGVINCRYIDPVFRNTDSLYDDRRLEVGTMEGSPPEPQGTIIVTEENWRQNPILMWREMMSRVQEERRQNQIARGQPQVPYDVREEPVFELPEPEPENEGFQVTEVGSTVSAPLSGGGTQRGRARTVTH